MSDWNARGNGGFYDLRLTFATLVLHLAGFTLDTYGHISTQMQQDAAQKMGGFLKQNL